MKKLMIMLAAIVVAAGVQAASVVNWNTGTIYAPGADGTGFSVTGDMIADGTEGLLATLYVGTGYEGNATDGYKLTGTVTFGSGFTSSDVVGGALNNTTDAVLADDTTYYAQVIVTYGESTLTSQIVSFETSALSGSADPYFGDGGMLISALPGNELDMTYGAFSSSGWTAVPEPTSGLLMLVGLGALALRRKRA